MYLSKTSINILLFIAVCILALGTWIGQIKKNRGNGAVAEEYLSTLSPAKIHTIKISNRVKTKATLEKRHNKWYMTQPLSIEANDFLATNVSKILSNNYSKSITADKKQLAQFGLSPALFTLRLNQEQVFFGQRNRISNQRYILYRGTVYLIRDQLLPILNSAPASFISHSIIPNGASIVGLDLIDFSLHRQNNKWLVSSPEKREQPASQDIIIKFIDDWRLAQALYISLEDQAINKPNIKATANVIYLDNGKNISLILSQDDSGATLYRPDPGIYYHMRNEAVQSLFALPKPKQESIR